MFNQLYGISALFLTFSIIVSTVNKYNEKFVKRVRKKV